MTWLDRRTEGTHLGLNTWSLGQFDWSESIDPESLLDNFAESRTPILQVASYYNGGKSNQYVEKWINNRSQPSSECHLVIQCGLREQPDGSVEAIRDPDELHKQITDTLDQLDRDTARAVQRVVGDPEEHDRSLLKPLIDLSEDGLTETIGLQYLTPGTNHDAGATELDFVTRPLNLLDVVGNFDVKDVTTSEDHPVFCYDPLSGGILTQHYAELNPEESDREVQKHHPDFSQTRQRSIRCVRALQQFAHDHEIGTNRVETLALAWLRHRLDSGVIFTELHDPSQCTPIGQSSDVKLTENQVEEMESIVQRTMENTQLPRFLSPPPVRPTHSYERHIAGRYLLPDRSVESTHCMN